MLRDGTQWNFSKLILVIQSDPLCGHTFNTHIADNTLAFLKIYGILEHDDVKEIEVYKLIF
jgi:hypothetical protein